MKDYSCPSCSSTNVFVNDDDDQRELRCGECGTFIQNVSTRELQMVYAFMEENCN